MPRIHRDPRDLTPRERETLRRAWHVLSLMREGSWLFGIQVDSFRWVGELGRDSVFLWEPQPVSVPLDDNPIRIWRDSIIQAERERSATLRGLEEASELGREMPSDQPLGPPD